MRPAAAIEELTRFERRIAGSDAERRAAEHLARAIGRAGRDAHLEAFWLRPNRALAHAWHVALALAGSLLAVHHPRVGGAMILAALLSVLADHHLGVSPGRRLTREHASQNVVSPPPRRDRQKRVRLIVTANYDAGRTGLVHRETPQAAVALIRRLTNGYGPGWLGWLTLALAWLLAIAIARLQGNGTTAIGVLQLIPTVALVIAIALLLDLASAEVSPAANDNASGVAVAIALMSALDAAPPRNLAVELVLQGASDGQGTGLERYLKRRRKQLKAENTVVLGIAACGAGTPRWWVSDGQLIPLRYLASLRRLCETIAGREPGLKARPHRGRGATPALRARIRHLPAIAIGCLDRRGLASRSHLPTDTPDRLDEAALDAALELGLLLADAIDELLGRRGAGAPPRGALTPA